MPPSTDQRATRPAKAILSFNQLCYSSAIVRNGFKSNVGGRSRNEIQGMCQNTWPGAANDPWDGHMSFLLGIASGARLQRTSYFLLTRVFIACHSSERTEKQHLLRLWRTIAAVGVTEIWSLHLPLVRRCPPRPGCAYLVCTQHLYGCVQGDRNRPNATWRQR